MHFNSCVNLSISVCSSMKNVLFMVVYITMFSNLLKTLWVLIDTDGNISINFTPYQLFMELPVVLFFLSLGTLADGVQWLCCLEHLYSRNIAWYQKQHNPVGKTPKRGKAQIGAISHKSEIPVDFPRHQTHFPVKMLVLHEGRESKPLVQVQNELHLYKHVPLSGFKKTFIL